jgi:hypothetical protein
MTHSRRVRKVNNGFKKEFSSITTEIMQMRGVELIKQ